MAWRLSGKILGLAGGMEDMDFRVAWVVRLRLDMM
jgi:hypothetical protein